MSEVTGASAQESAEMIRCVLKGTAGPARDIALLNAAAALVVAGRESSLELALKVAADSIESGAAARSLEALVRWTHA